MKKNSSAFSLLVLLVGAAVCRMVPGAAGEGPESDPPSARPPSTFGAAGPELSPLGKGDPADGREVVHPDGADLKFADLADLTFVFSSGVGAWHTELRISPDGTFRGEHSDDDMGVTGPGYPNGTRYYCAFSGRFSGLRKTGDHEYSMRCESISQEGTTGEEEISEDGVRLIVSSPYGLDDADEVLLYLPGRKLDGMPEGVLDWAYTLRGDGFESGGVLDFYWLYNVGGGQGFIGGF